VGEERQRQPDRREVVDEHRPLDVVGREVGDVAAQRDPGVVDQDVEAAELGLRSGGQLVDRRQVGEVDGPRARVGAVAAAVGQHLGQPVLPPGADADCRPGGGEGPGQRGPDARRRSGDEDLLPSSIEHL
jgi:hypothetical protein